MSDAGLVGNNGIQRNAELNDNIPNEIGNQQNNLEYPIREYEQERRYPVVGTTRSGRQLHVPEKFNDDVLHSK